MFTYLYVFWTSNICTAYREVWENDLDVTFKVERGCLLIVYMFISLQDDLNVDKFVLECRRRVSMETLRDDLTVYLKVLKTAMIELINKDYADFVNLSTNLVSWNHSILEVEMSFKSAESMNQNYLLKFLLTRLKFNSNDKEIY